MEGGYNEVAQPFASADPKHLTTQECVGRKLGRKTVVTVANVVQRTATKPRKQKDEQPKSCTHNRKVAGSNPGARDHLQNWVTSFLLFSTSILTDDCRPWNEGDDDLRFLRTRSGFERPMLLLLASVFVSSQSSSCCDFQCMSNHESTYYR